jgi:catechol 2,3-dioxygenase-like lactoylglutathione lyase family enzyme
MEPIIDHIEITVRDMTVAVGFYDKLLPLLGFDLGKKSSARIEQHEKHVVSYGLSWRKRSIAENQGRCIILHLERHLRPRSIAYIWK